jgi:hypothetical protein
VGTPGNRARPVPQPPPDRGPAGPRGREERDGRGPQRGPRARGDAGAVAEAVERLVGRGIGGREAPAGGDRAPAVPFEDLPEGGGDREPEARSGRVMRRASRSTFLQAIARRSAAREGPEASARATGTSRQRRPGRRRAGGDRERSRRWTSTGAGTRGPLRPGGRNRLQGASRANPYGTKAHARAGWYPRQDATLRPSAGDHRRVPTTPIDTGPTPNRRAGAALPSSWIRTHEAPEGVDSHERIQNTAPRTRKNPVPQKFASRNPVA